MVGQVDAAGGGALAVDQLQVPALHDPFEQPRTPPERNRVQDQAKLVNQPRVGPPARLPLP